MCESAFLWRERGVRGRVQEIDVRISLTHLILPITIAHGFGRNGPARKAARRNERGPGF